MFQRTTRVLAAFLTLTLAAITQRAGAQSDDDANGAVQFNFSTPGARSLAMGGTAVGAADDATAAYTNPAGLLHLSEPEVAIEARRWRFATPFASHGRASGRPTGIGADTVAGVELGAAEAELDGISFASFVYPRPKWAFSAYYHQVASFRADFATGGIFGRDGNRNSRLYPIQSSYDLDISQIGLAYAQKWRGLTVGFGVSVYSFALDSLTQRFKFAPFHAPASFDPDLRVNFQSQTGKAEEVGFNIGVRLELGKKTTFGMVYRFGPEFDLRIRSGVPAPDLPPSQQVIFDDAQAIFNLPDVIGYGLSYRASQALTINLDVDRVMYSDLVEDFFIIFDQEVSDPEELVIDDVDEIRLGVEYVFAQSHIPVALRLGVWLDPDHRLRAEGGSELNQVRLFAGEDQLHYSAGVGVVITSHFQIDAAVDFSEIADTASLSIVYRF